MEFLHFCPVLLSLLPSFVDADFCSYYSGTKYCRYGCCGTYWSPECCPESDNLGTILGATIGGICFMIFIVSVIVIVLCQKAHRAPVPGRNLGQVGPTVIQVRGQQGHAPPLPNYQYVNPTHSLAPLPATLQNPAYPPPVPPPAYYQPPGQPVSKPPQSTQLP